MAERFPAAATAGDSYTPCKRLGGSRQDFAETEKTVAWS